MDHEHGQEASADEPGEGRTRWHGDPGDAARAPDSGAGATLESGADAMADHRAHLRAELQAARESLTRIAEALDSLAARIDSEPHRPARSDTGQSARGDSGQSASGDSGRQGAVPHSGVNRDSAPPPGAAFPAPPLAAPRAMTVPPLPALPPVAWRPAPREWEVEPEPEPAPWADTTGMKALGWVGGGITVLGIVLLLVLAVQQGFVGPRARIVTGVVLGLLLIGAALALHPPGRPFRQPARPAQGNRGALAVILGGTGLAVEYLTAIGAVRMAHLVRPEVGLASSAVIVALAVWLAKAWREPWLAAVSFCATALLAPAVGGGATGQVLIFETVLVAGAAAGVLLRIGLMTWLGAGGGAVVVFLAGIIRHPDSPVVLFTVIVVTVVAWALFLARWITGAAMADPGPFPLRTRPADPEQVARDYADFHAHQARRRRARGEDVTATVSLAVAAGLLVIAVAMVTPPSGERIAVAIIAAIVALVCVGVAWTGQQLPPLRSTATAVVAWSAALAFAGLAADRFLSEDARSLAWLLLAGLGLVAAAANRSARLLLPALAAAVLALAASAPALDPADLVRWPAPRLVGADGLLPRGWEIVLPAGVAVILLCAAAWRAVAACSSAARPDAGSGAAEGMTDGATRSAATGAADGIARGAAASWYRVPGQWRLSEAGRTTVLRWMMVGCVAVACYGVLASAMVVAYAISPTRAGYQGGQVAVTILVTLIGLALLWQGFRRIAFRIGGLVFAAVAMAKLLLFDTGSLEALPRAMTFIGVGALLLIGAMLYLRALVRLTRREAPAEPDPVPGGFSHEQPVDPLPPSWSRESSPGQ